MCNVETEDNDKPRKPQTQTKLILGGGKYVDNRTQITE